jgi:2-polyprenyl-3-methyl-5-hydroxy-6-metoxy-1,4-benzoquinol methylase
MIVKGVEISKASITDLQGTYDGVMMHHSLEHSVQQHETFEALARILKPGAKALIRIPLSDSWAWKNYGDYWNIALKT